MIFSFIKGPFCHSQCPTCILNDLLSYTRSQASFFLEVLLRAQKVGSSKIVSTLTRNDSFSFVLQAFVEVPFKAVAILYEVVGRIEHLEKKRLCPRTTNGIQTSSSSVTTRTSEVRIAIHFLPTQHPTKGSKRGLLFWQGYSAFTSSFSPSQLVGMPSTKSLPITPLSLRNQLFFGMWLMALSLSRQRCVVSAFQATRTSVSQCGLMIPSTRLFETTTGDAEEEYVATASLLEKLQNTNNIRDQCISAISGDGSIKVTVATVRNMINDLSLQHTMTEVPTDALGRTVTCGLLMANGMQDEQTVQITLNGMC